MAANLQAIKEKTRRLTRTLSLQQLPDADLLEYINTFILYDMPVNIRLFTLEQTFTFYTSPNIDTYDTNTVSLTHPLYDFKNKVNSIMQPIFVDGYKMYYTQDRNEFFNLYPYVNSVVQVGTGDGATTAFAGTLTGAPVLLNEVTFTSFDANNEALVLKDIPQIDGATGETLVLGDLVEPNNDTVSLGTINYKTGDYSFNFPAAPDATAPIDSHTVPVALSRPYTILFYDNTLTVRPVPDKAYKITMNAYIRPTAFMADADVPELEQWWQYIAIGASLKIFEDRSDYDSIAKLMTIFKEQERLALRRTLQLQSNERSATIYSGQTSDNNYNGYGSNGPF